jgi:hypothetical protein
MRTGRPKQPIILEAADKEKLELLARRPNRLLKNVPGHTWPSNIAFPHGLTR